MKNMMSFTIKSQEQCLRSCRNMRRFKMLKRLLNKIFRRKKTKNKDDFNRSFADADTALKVYKEETTSVILGTLLNNHALGSSIAHQSKKIK